MDIAIYLTSVEWFDQHFPCSSMNQLFVDFSNYIGIHDCNQIFPGYRTIELTIKTEGMKRETRSDSVIYII